MTGTATPGRPDPVDFLTGRLSDEPLPGGISLPGHGGKFATDGSVQHWPGNTFVRHVAPGAAHDAIRTLQEDIKMSRFARLFTFLPPSSFHMTVFQGISPTRLADHDPSVRDAASTRLDADIRDLAFPATRTVRATDLFCAHSLTVTGLDSEEENGLRQERSALRDATGILSADFDSYVFHITLAYLIEWLSEPTAIALAEFSGGLGQRLTGLLAEIALGPVEFCDFDTMHHFAPRRQLV